MVFCYEPCILVVRYGLKFKFRIGATDRATSLLDPSGAIEGMPT